MTSRTLRVGPLSAVLDGVELRWICYNDCEVLRGIYGSVRDDAWRTIPPKVKTAEIQQTSDRIDVRFRVDHSAEGIGFGWRGHVALTASGIVQYRFHGVAHRTFARNRIGLCVLHPISLAGTPVTITSVSGNRRAATFPEEIDPGSPFLDIAMMRWANHQMVATLEFVGDAFETEDQRNWADASYKTFCTPLALPHPVTIAAGTRVAQGVTLRVKPINALTKRPRLARSRPASTDVVSFDLAATRPMPELGTCLAPGHERLTDAQVAALAELGFSSLRVVVDLSWRGWQDRLLAAASVASRVGSRLAVELVMDVGHVKLAEFVRLIGSLDTPPVHCLVFPADGYATSASDVEHLRETVNASGQSLLVGGGSRASFAELNRAALPLEMLDLIGCPIASLVHAVDDATAMENIEALAHVVRGCLRASNGRPVIVGPVTLRPRYNAYGLQRASLGPESDSDRLDPRQQAPFAATWTLAAVSELVTASAVILHEVSGPAGLLPEADDPTGRSAYAAVRLLTSARPGRLVEAVSPAGMAAFGLTDGAAIRGFVANLTDRTRALDLRLAGDDDARCSVSTVVGPYGWTSVELPGQ
ncbi:MAG: hypothetical protein BGO26_01225 [Actinobacteria bacterium 69-20]|jgi:hypothetical protein|nr:hypothetical protein [Actinomycetota bacterium]OJV23766.1 MAG: hypothetical protein BGO26_01225 [Actinobacteria bacterium 69-20]